MILEELKPITQLTVDIIQSIKIHTTYSSFRTEMATKVVKKVDATDSVPTLYYVQVGTGDRLVWEVHAMAVDLTRFLLVHNIPSED
jgi:hypothetical protein